MWGTNSTSKEKGVTSPFWGWEQAGKEESESTGSEIEAVTSNGGEKQLLLNCENSLHAEKGIQGKKKVKFSDGTRKFDREEDSMCQMKIVGLILKKKDQCGEEF